MHQERVGRRRFRPFGGRLLPVAVALPMVLTGCSAVSAPSGLGSGGAPGRGMPGTLRGAERLRMAAGDGHGRTADPEDAAVVSAWIAAEQAFEGAALTADPDEPDLAATTLPPQLGISVAALTEMRDAGDVAVGTPSWAAPRVEAGPGGRATVRACLHDSEIVVNRISRAPVPGILGEVADESFTSVMTLTADGWKLTDQTIRDRSCTA